MAGVNLLLGLPTPLEGIERHLVGDTLQLTLEEADALASRYYEAVELHLRGCGVAAAGDDDESDDGVVPALQFALRLFNAENFSGELSPAERTRYGAVLQRFGGVVVKSGRHGAAQVDEGEGEKHEDEEQRESAREAAAGAAGASVLSSSSPVLASVQRERLQDLFLQRLLTADGEMPVATLRLPGLLLAVLAMAKAELVPGAPLLPLTSPWRLRALFRHQLCLSRRSNTIFLALADCVDAVLRQPSEEQTVAMLLEVGHVQSYYHRRDLAKETFETAMHRSGLRVEETSMMGVRTRWQQHQLVQMVLNATSRRPVPPASTTDEQPKTIMAERDGHDLLDRPRETPEATAESVAPLHPEDKAILLALCMDIRNNNPDHGLTQHHMMIYIERLLADPAPSPFMVRCQTLLMRARLEARRNRVQERAFMQLTELVDQYSAARRDPTHEVFGRTASAHFYSVAFPPIWALQREYADMCFEETLYKTALDVYEQILDWESIIECCKKLDKRRRCESLARELIEKDPLNPMLWVALGEATRDDAHLWKAWELCGHKMAAPMRALARLALDREHYDKVVEYFDAAVRINPVFGGDWFALGYAALRLQRLSRSGEAFTRVCQIDPSDAFGWNNLASVMLRERKLRPAFNAMSQAIRNNRRDWRMWQNYFRIGCELKEVTETTNALSIALDIAKRQIQLERGTLELFVANTIAYLKGEIPGTSVDAAADADTHAHRSLGTLPDENDIRHAPVAHTIAAGAAAGDGEEEMADLVPLGADVDLLPDAAAAAAAAVGMTAEAEAAAAEREAVLDGVHRRHADRVRALFARIVELFVSDPDIYSCAATLMRFLDGPIASFRYRQKELRACEQKDQWCREETLFSRTVECLQAMEADLFDAFAEAQEAGAAGASEPAHTGAASPPTLVTGEALQQAVLHGFKETHANIKGALDAAEEHMAEHAAYAQLRELATRVRRGVQEAKAAFD
ncbi:Tetratricopeptide repeat [Novymonas esmeraldas]|uniref:Tetratricopeptide repeat n=1 Tax=Novymonas esmeraldas TaxID=1808958 RepID=A0AAW0ER77_9TRYP